MDSAPGCTASKTSIYNPAATLPPAGTGQREPGGTLQRSTLPEKTPPKPGVLVEYLHVEPAGQPFEKVDMVGGRPYFTSAQHFFSALA